VWFALPFEIKASNAQVELSTNDSCSWANMPTMQAVTSTVGGSNELPSSASGILFLEPEVLHKSKETPNTGIYFPLHIMSYEDSMSFRQLEHNCILLSLPQVMTFSPTTEFLFSHNLLCWLMKVRHLLPHSHHGQQGVRVTTMVLTYV